MSINSGLLFLAVFGVLCFFIVWLAVKWGIR